MIELQNKLRMRQFHDIFVERTTGRRLLLSLGAILPFNIHQIALKYRTRLHAYSIPYKNRHFYFDNYCLQEKISKIITLV